MNIFYQQDNNLLIKHQRRIVNFFFETIKAYYYDNVIRNRNSSNIEKFHASLEVGKYLGKIIRKEY